MYCMCFYIFNWHNTDQTLGHYQWVWLNVWSQKDRQIKKRFNLWGNRSILLSSSKHRTLLKRESNFSTSSIVVAMLIHMYRLFIISILLLLYYAESSAWHINITSCFLSMCVYSDYGYSQ